MMIKRTANKPGMPGGNVDDAALVRLFRQGDTAACRTVESQMRAAVLSAGHLPADDLQDLLQEATVQLWRYVSVDGFELRGSFRSLAVRIALARRIDRIRRRRFLVELDDDLRDDSRGALELLAEKERLAGLHRALGGIRELCRVLVRGRFLENRTYEELGAELDRTPETLRVHLHRCLRVLRGMIEIGDNRL
jgi:RNA polymerase sigma factor (sigma-70 family)